MKIYTPIFFALLFCANSVFAQQSKSELAQNYVSEQSQAWQLNDEDITELVVSDQYESKHNGVTHVFLSQHYKGIPIYNAIQTLAVTRTGKVLTVGKTRLVGNLSEKVNIEKPGISAVEAIGKLYNHVEKRALPSNPKKLRTEGPTTYFSPEGIAKQEISSRLVYQLMPNGELLLAYQVKLDQLGTSDWWNARIDAKTGELLAKDNFTISCKFDHDHFQNHDRACDVKVRVKKTDSPKSVQANSYKVVPFPVESPAHGPFEIVSNPADAEASPYGWHDVDGVDGAEYTITRGNNVHAFSDHLDTGTSSGDEPDGGATLDFDFDSDFSDDPTEYAKGATTNLFYWLNIMHDFTYAYGFDEAAGNFQQTNYSGTGLGGDYIRANAQDGYLITPTPNLNNANYSGGGDGGTPQIQMYVWDGNSGGGTKFLTVSSPNNVAGEYGATAAAFGPQIPDIPISAEVVEVNDGAYSPYITDGCETVMNVDEITGKIALVDRGGCFFQQKALTAEEAGAVAIIICNFEDEPVGMAAAPTLAQPTIPTIMIGGIDCATIRSFAGNGLTAQIGQPANSGPQYLDGDFDNGIIAHEIGHGISNRLTGGPGAGGCLGNAEQMGEGWSDYFALVTSVNSTDNGADRRGVGTFVNRQENDGRGIRRYPYSTDMSISPLTYGDVASNTGVHAVGEVWANALWDLYWALVDVYGFDEDLYHGTKGNNLAVQLVMDGMKFQGCQPGFLDGRDGILMADQVLNNGANSCLIWEVFARRGMGYYADQGSSNSASDQIENFDPFPLCIEDLKVEKEVTPLVEAGNMVDIKINLLNHKPETITAVEIKETLPAGMTFVAGSSSIAPSVNGNELTFTIDQMEYQEEIDITFQVETDPDNYSTEIYFEGAENNGLGWSPIPVEGQNIWALTDNANTGAFAYEVESPASASQQIILVEEEIEVTGDQPVIRFYHRFNTESGQDGGVFQVTDDFASGFWSNFDNELIFRNSYSGAVDYQTFVIPNFSTWFGNSDGYQASYIDMKDWLGKKIFTRFNFGSSDDNGPGAPTNGYWSVDDFELMDMVNYNPETCVNFDGGEQLCIVAEGRGTVVESQIVSGTKNIQNSGISFGVFPNPASDALNISVQSLKTGNADLSLLTIDGKVIHSQSVMTHPSSQNIALDVSNVSPGFYIVRFANQNGAVNKKVIIQ